MPTAPIVSIVDVDDLNITGIQTNATINIYLGNGTLYHSLIASGGFTIGPFVGLGSVYVTQVVNGVESPASATVTFE
ncbi:hypothetical protein [Bacillus sp. FJAT-42315]|uniref:hypothetical protein n=1 Tax=Bacillus sp. FJAT-42315 TaxID=2014077 RepID=UPI000C24B5AD|nr:hypothetical protein [Bacillus sp. FJAT-42315]